MEGKEGEKNQRRGRVGGRQKGRWERGRDKKHPKVTVSVLVLNVWNFLSLKPNPR